MSQAARPRRDGSAGPEPAQSPSGGSPWISTSPVTPRPSTRSGPRPGSSVRRATSRWWSGEEQDDPHQQRPPGGGEDDEPFVRRFVSLMTPARTSDHNRWRFRRRRAAGTVRRLATFAGAPLRTAHLVRQVRQRATKGSRSAARHAGARLDDASRHGVAVACQENAARAATTTPIEMATPLSTCGFRRPANRPPAVPPTTLDTASSAA